MKMTNVCAMHVSSCSSTSTISSHHENHLYTPSPTMTDAVLVIAALLLPIPNTLLLARTAASFALSCECPDTYVNAPRPMNVALPVRLLECGVNASKRGSTYRPCDMACSPRTVVCPPPLHVHIERGLVLQAGGSVVKS
jgi:hypothetical protein